MNKIRTKHLGLRFFRRAVFAWGTLLVMGAQPGAIAGFALSEAIADTTTASPSPAPETCAQECAPYANGQLPPTTDPSYQQATQCMAYNQAGKGKGFDAILMAMDVGALGTCTIACVASSMPIGATLFPICKYLGMAASVAELIKNLTQKNDAAGQAISALGAGLTIGGGPLLNAISKPGTPTTPPATTPPKTPPAGSIQIENEFNQTPPMLSASLEEQLLQFKSGNDFLAVSETQFSLPVEDQKCSIYNHLIAFAIDVMATMSELPSQIGLESVAQADQCTSVSITPSQVQQAGGNDVQVPDGAGNTCLFTCSPSSTGSTCNLHGIQLQGSTSGTYPPVNESSFSLSVAPMPAAPATSGGTAGGSSALTSVLPAVAPLATQLVGGGGKAGSAAGGGGGLGSIFSTKGDINPGTDCAGASASKCLTKQGKEAACMAMVGLTLAVAARIMSMKAQSNSQNQACQAVTSLQSGSSVVGGGGSAPTMTAAAGVGSTPDTAAAAQAGLGCVAQSGLSSCAQQSGIGAGVAAASDGGILSGLGVDKPLAQNALNMGLGDLAKAVDGGASAADIIGNATAGTPLSGALAAIGKAVEEGGSGMDLHPGVASVSAGGGGAGKGDGDAAFDPSAMMAALMGGAKDGKQQLGVSEVGYGRAPSNDIWHAGSKKSLFEIVTERTQQNLKNVDRAEWASPMNRALNGLPKNY